MTCPDPSTSTSLLEKELNPDARKPLRAHQQCHLPTRTLLSWPVAESVSLGARGAFAIELCFFLELSRAVTRRVLTVDEKGLLIFRLRPTALRVLRDFALVMVQSVSALIAID